MSECERYEIMISALLDGELDERDQAELSAHVAGCERCGALAAAFAAVSGTLAESLEEPPAQLHGAVMEKVEAAAKVKRGRNRFMLLRPIIAAAACVAVVVITLLAANRGVQNAENTSAAAPETAVYAAAGSAGSADIGGESDGALTMEAPDAAPAGAAMDNSAPETRKMLDDAMDTAMAEEEAEESEPDAPAELPSLEVEAVAAGDGFFTARVLADPNGYFAPGTTLTVLSDDTASPGTRVTIRYSGVSIGEELGAYCVTAEELEFRE